jgi:hypothetical protein
MMPRSIAWAAYNAHSIEEVNSSVMAISTSLARDPTMRTNVCNFTQREEEKCFNLRTRKADPASR